MTPPQYFVFSTSLIQIAPQLHREETRGIDCITRGKYGYIDPDGKRREFTYVSGLPCDEGAQEGDGFEDSNDIVRSGKTLILSVCFLLAMKDN